MDTSGPAVSEPAEQLTMHLRRPIQTVVVETPSGAMGMVKDLSLL
jgi:hypothetical protein